MATSIEAEGLGVRFLFDRYQRAVTPALARVRRSSVETWGVRDLSFAIGPGEGVALISLTFWFDKSDTGCSPFPVRTHAVAKATGTLDLP